MHSGWCVLLLQRWPSSATWRSVKRGFRLRTSGQQSMPSVRWFKRPRTAILRSGARRGEAAPTGFLGRHAMGLLRNVRACSTCSPRTCSTASCAGRQIRQPFRTNDRLIDILILRRGQARLQSDATGSLGTSNFKQPVRKALGGRPQSSRAECEPFDRTAARVTCSAAFLRFQG